LQGKSEISLKYILGLLNSNLITFFHWHKSVKAQRDLFPKITLYDLKNFPIYIAKPDKQQELIMHVNKILELKRNFHQKTNIDFMKYVEKYACQGMFRINHVFTESGFKNALYNGKAKTLRSLSLFANENILTITEVNSNGKRFGLLKFEVKDHFQRQYLKLYLENLTEEQLAEINQYSGNILDKVLRIGIPDYDKSEVIRKVVNEWNQLQAEIKVLEKKIEATDKEVDQMVYELYGLTEEKEYCIL
jgi:hypothetical protein